MNNFYTGQQLAAIRRDELLAEASRARRARAARTGHSAPPGKRRARRPDRPRAASFDD